MEPKIRIEGIVKLKEVYENANTKQHYAVLSGIATSLGWIFSFQALYLGDASIVNTLLATQPIIAIALSYLLLKEIEIITLTKAVGALIVVLGVVLLATLR